jgi:7-keto-8-aminopelargonate synthetase-like enzyme
MDAASLVPAIASLITALGSLGGAAVLLAKARAERLKIEAERTRVESETSSLAKKSDLDRAVRLIDQLQEDNDRLRARLSEMESRDEARDAEIMTLKSGVLMLIAQLRGLGVIPVWQPDWVVCPPVEPAENDEG